ncbi:hypothetical protein RhiLY_07355 [Ceratobasidium sp. AG-Ba]|nr:hypothetical protein RhiLY_07355 [Ceratobasidium sp. AG-Ba]
MQRKKQPIVHPLAPASAPPTKACFRCAYNSQGQRRIPSSSTLAPSRTTVALALPLRTHKPRASSVCHPKSHFETMLHFNIARDEHVRSARKPPVFDAVYSSPDGSESSCSHRSRSRSRSPEPRPAVRRTSLSRSNTVSHSRSVSHGMPTLPRSQTHPANLSHATMPTRRPSRTCNEDVLRSRLEGVLSSASSSRDISCPPSPSHRRRGDSLALGLITPPHGLSAHPPMSRSRTSPAISRSSRPSATSSSLMTPPPSPPFDANQISLQLREKEGYVSFADVQGLGVPNGVDEEDQELERGRGRWWTLWKG